MKALRHILAACLTAALLCTSVFAFSGFNAELSIDRDTEGQISVTVQDSSVLTEKRPTLTIPCDYAYAKVTCPDNSVAYCTGTGSGVSFTVFMGGTYLIESISELPSGGGGDNPGGNLGSGGGGSSSMSDVTKGEDGSTTVTTVNRQTGEVTKTTTTTEGIIGTTVTDKNGVVLDVEGNTVVKIIDNSVDFSDVSSADWYQAAVDFVSARSLFGGVSTTEAVFGGDGFMTRGMLVVVIHRLENGIVSGIGGNVLDPKGSATRAQVAQMLKNYLENVQKP